MQVKLRGIEDIKRTVSRWEATRMAAVQDLVIKTAREIRKEARRRVPVRTGKLKKSIVVKYNKNKTAAFIRAVAPYSHIVELGSASKNITARPFLQPSADAAVPGYIKELQNIFGEVE